MLTSSRDSLEASSLCTRSCMALSLSSRWRVMCSTCPGPARRWSWQAGSPAFPGRTPDLGRQENLGNPSVNGLP